MHTLIRSSELPPSGRGTVRFEGEPHGSEVSFFLVNNLPGEGPDLGPETPHGFKNIGIGDERLEIFCIHASPRMIQVELES